MLIWNLLEEAAKAYPDRVALCAGDKALTYELLAEEVWKLTGGLANIGLSPGDRFALLLPNTIELVIAILAANLARLIVVPLLPFNAPAQNGYILSNSEPKALLTTTKLAEHIPTDSLRTISTIILADGNMPVAIDHSNLVTTMPLDSPISTGDGLDPISILVYTSGTTGYPKGVVHTQSRLVNRAELFVKELSLTDSDATIASLHIGRPIMLVSTLLAMFRVGGLVSLLEYHDIDLFWDIFQKTNPTYCIVTPGYANEILANAGAATADFSRLRFWINAGDKPSEKLHGQILETTGRPLLDMFGSTETGFLAINPPDGCMKIGSIGKPMQGVEMRLVDQGGRNVEKGQVGRLLVRTANMMLGYWKDSEQTQRAIGTGWFDMQDLLKADEDGYFWFVGRVGDLIVRDGRNVASFMVVESLTRYPDIEDAIVVGVRDSRVGQVPVAFYRLKSTATEPSPEVLASWVAQWADALSIPVAFYRMDQWPLTPQGKVDRKQLVQLAESQINQMC